MGIIVCLGLIVLSMFTMIVKFDALVSGGGSHLLRRPTHLPFGVGTATDSRESASRSASSHQCMGGEGLWGRSGQDAVAKQLFDDALRSRLCRFRNVCYKENVWKYYYNGSHHPAPILGPHNGDLSTTSYPNFIDVRPNWLDLQPTCHFQSCQSFMLEDRDFPHHLTVPLKHGAQGEAHAVLIQPFWPENFGLSTCFVVCFNLNGALQVMSLGMICIQCTRLKPSLELSQIRRILMSF